MKNKVYTMRKPPSYFAAFFLILFGFCCGLFGLYYAVSSAAPLPVMIGNYSDLKVVAWNSAPYIAMNFSMMVAGIAIVLYRKKGCCEDLIYFFHFMAIINALIVFVMFFFCTLIYTLIQSIGFIPPALVLFIYTVGRGVSFKKLKLSWMSIMIGAVIIIGSVASVTAGSFAEYTKLSIMNETIENAADFTKFKAECLDGSELTEAFFKKNKLTVVNCWATTCDPCIRELPELDELNNEKQDSGVKIVGICVDVRQKSGVLDEKLVQDARSIVETSNVNYPIVIPSEELTNGILKEVNVFPTTFFIDSEGKIQKTILGSNSKEDWENTINQYLNNK